MGGQSSKSEWQPPEQDLSMSASGSVDYHMVCAPVRLGYSYETCCLPVLTVRVDCDTFYEMLGEQYDKGYHLLHITRSPGDLKATTSLQNGQFNMLAFFRKNAERGANGRHGDAVIWKLLVEKSWFQTYVHHTNAYAVQERVVHTKSIVESIDRNVQHGERLISLMVTGQTEPGSRRGMDSGMSPHFGVDLFFEIPTANIPVERFTYNIELVPVSARFEHPGFIYFPDIKCDWTEVLNRLLGQGWRLIDIYIDLPMIEQLHTPQKRKGFLLLPTKTNALWILEKPVSRMNDLTPMYEGTIVEHPVKVTDASKGFGCQSFHEWHRVVRDMGSRGWELACTLETHFSEQPRFSTSLLKSLLFFQRPLQKIQAPLDLML